LEWPIHSCFLQHPLVGESICRRNCPQRIVHKGCRVGAHTGLNRAVYQVSESNALDHIGKSVGLLVTDVRLVERYAPNVRPIRDRMGGFECRWLRSPGACHGAELMIFIDAMR
jgi:hypothetical protein